MDLNASHVPCMAINVWAITSGGGVAYRVSPGKPLQPALALHLHLHLRYMCTWAVAVVWVTLTRSVGLEASCASAPEAMPAAGA